MFDTRGIARGTRAKRVLVIGVGNPYRRDDGFGRLIARAVREHGPPGITVIEHSGEGASLMALWAPDDAVFIFDAVSSGNPAGTMVRINACATTIPSDFFHYSTHAFSVAEAIEMARVLGTLPAALVLFGVEGTHFEGGEGLSRPVAAALENALPGILEEIRIAYEATQSQSFENSESSTINA